MHKEMNETGMCSHVCVCVGSQKIQHQMTECACVCVCVCWPKRRRWQNLGITNRATSLRAIDEFTVIKGKLSSAMNLDKIHIHMRAKGGWGCLVGGVWWVVCGGGSVRGRIVSNW